MKIEFVTGVAVIAADPPTSRMLYRDVIGVQFEADGEYHHTEHLAGLRHFGVWPLEEAARACFGTAEWPAGLPVPQASVEFEVADADAVAAAARELEDAGYALLHPPRTEPWGQTVARIQSPEGLVVGISYAPAMHA